MCFQAIPVPQEEVSSADEAQAAKRRRLPSGSALPADTPMETTDQPTCPVSTPRVAAPAAPAAEHHSINALPTSQPLSQLSDTPAPASGVQMDAQTSMDTSSTLSDAQTESDLASDPTLTLHPTPFQSTLNSDPLLSASSPQPPPQHMSESYTPSSGYVSYMETLLHSHFPQYDGHGHLY